MEYTLDLGAWNAVFAVPCSLVDRHIKLAGKEQLQVILWMLRHAGEPFRPEELAEALQLSMDSVLDAIEYWQDRGLLAAKEGDLIPVPQPQAEKKAVRAAAEEPPAQEQPEPARNILPPKARMTKPDAGYLAKRMKESEAIRYLIQEAEATLGMPSPAMTSVLVGACDDYGLPVEVAVMIVHYAKEVGKTSTHYIESVARDWAESGIFTLEAAEAKLQELGEKRLAWSRVSAAAGLPKRSPSKKEEEAAYRWVSEWRFSQEMLAAAYERCVDSTGKFSAAYINKVLERWHKDGLKTPADVEQAENKNKQKKGGKKSSYDIDEVESISFFDPPEDL